jgi:formate dehydrogenase subunit beta
MPVNSAIIISKMTRVSPSTRKMAVVLRSCEIRALVELVKLKQASLENIIIVGVDCTGTHSIQDYAELVSKGKEAELRLACKVCEYPAPQTSDITIGVIGLDGKRISVSAGTSQGEEVLNKLGLKPDASSERDEAISKLVSERTRARDGLFQITQNEMSGMDRLLSVFATCIGCHNCMKVCPICYCRECFFESPTFEDGAESYIKKARRRGSIEMPTDTMLFHLTRMNHMVTSCVGCGMCEQACPSSIPLLKIFKTVGHQVQQVFEYVPGRSIKEEIPLTTFKEDELHEVGE